LEFRLELEQGLESVDGFQDPAEQVEQFLHRVGVVAAVDTGQGDRTG